MCCHVVSLNVKPFNGFKFSHSPSPPAITMSHLVHSLFELLYVKEVYFCSFVTKFNNQSSMHQIFTHVYSKVSIRPSYMERLLGFLHVPPPQKAFPHILPQNLLLLSTHYFLIRTLWKIEKQIQNLPSWESIPYHCTWTMTWYPLSHWCTLQKVNLKHCITNIKSL